MAQSAEQEIVAKGYVHPEALLATRWVADDLDGTRNIRIVLSHLLVYENVRNYDGSRTEWGKTVLAPIER